jgi:hypothetical protein
MSYLKVNHNMNFEDIKMIIIGSVAILLAYNGLIITEQATSISNNIVQLSKNIEGISTITVPSADPMIYGMYFIMTLGIISIAIGFVWINRINKLLLRIPLESDC